MFVASRLRTAVSETGGLECRHRGVERVCIDADEQPLVALLRHSGRSAGVMSKVRRADVPSAS